MSLKENIRNWILLNIRNGVWLPGDRIPSITQISREFSASRETVRLSLENLVQRGELLPKQGMGYFVASQNKVNFRVALLCKIDGVYIKPIYQGLIDEREEDIAFQVNEIRQSDKKLTVLLEDLISRQAIDRLLVVPIAGKEEEIDKVLKPFKRRIQIGWIDKAPAAPKEPVFLCNYEACVEIAVNHFRENNLDRIFYFSRNPEDQSIFTKMRDTFKNAVSQNSIMNGIIHDWQHLVSIINETSHPVGIMTEQDMEAVYLLSRLKANRIRIPQQASIISCDNSEITEVVSPSITSIDPGWIELGRKVRMWVQGNYKDENSTSPLVIYSSPVLISKESSV